MSENWFPPPRPKEKDRRYPLPDDVMDEEIEMDELQNFTDWLNDQEPIDADGVGDYSATEGVMFQWMIDEVERLRDTVEYYADPETYVAIGFFPDPPCGDFINDCDETEYGVKPGKRARNALKNTPKG